MRTAFIGIWLCLFAASIAFSQGTKPIDAPEVAQRRDELIRDLQRASIPIYEAYLKSLEPLKAQYARDGNLENIASLQNEINRVQHELDNATHAASRSNNAVNLGFAILKATYGAHEKNQTIETTEILRKAFRDGKKTFKLSSSEEAGGKDPAPRVHKETVIIYSVGGQRKEKTFKEGYDLNFETDLN